MRTFYIQKEKDTNIITDVIEYQKDGYTSTQLETPLPQKILTGCYKLINGSSVYVPELDFEMRDLKADQQLLSDALSDMIMGGM